MPEVAEDEAVADEASSVLSLPLVHDAASLLNATDHSFSDDHEPANSSLGGYNGTFESLVLCIGVGIKKEAVHDCLLWCGGAFVWSRRTLEKLGNRRGERMRFLL